MPSDNAAQSPLSWKLARVAGRALALLGAAAVLLSGWLMAGGSTGLERLVVEADVPRPARAIVCITGGIASHGLPTPEGWDRIYAAVQLLADGLTPAIIFSGGATRRSAFPSFKPNEKDYGDPLNRLRWGLNDTIVALREVLAIGVYRYRGQA